jgi:hypothetical protein
MKEENDEGAAARSGVYVFGDEEAGAEVKLPKAEIRKMRVGGLLEGAYAIIGHRTIVYHRGKLRQRVNEAFTAEAVAAWRQRKNTATNRQAS